MPQREAPTSPRADERMVDGQGRLTRQGFAMILHGEGSPPTTLTSAWTPRGLCPKD